MNSNKIKAFLDFIDECKNMHDLAFENMKKEDARLQDLLHAIEFETKTKERSKLCTKLHKSRIERREYKNAVELTEDIVNFFQEPQHKKTLDQMRQLLGKVRKVEKYHNDRVYNRKIEI
ncbi:MAG: hypothetical protein IJZ53_01470 [Tyzzerella sp.]|nr:hypothetical protein [Tyzzerella sp.]